MSIVMDSLVSPSSTIPAALTPSTLHPQQQTAVHNAVPDGIPPNVEAGPSQGPPQQQQASKPEVDLSKHPSGIIPQLQNVVSTCYLGRKLDLKHIAMHARNAEYNPKRFAAVIMRIREPKTTALIFSSGKMVCTGAKSEGDSRLAARKYARIIQKLGFDDAKFQDFKIQNIVGSCDVQFPIRLEGLHYKHSLFSSYEPELFPGLIYKMKKPKVVLLIFVSGKVVLTGAKYRSEIYQAFEAIYPALTEFRKGDAAQMQGRPAPSNLPGPPAKRLKAEDQEGSAFLNPGVASGATAGVGGAVPCPTPTQDLPPQTPAFSLPPPSPVYGAGGAPSSSAHFPFTPATPMYNLPPPTPAYARLPPATPSHLPPPSP